MRLAQLQPEEAKPAFPTGLQPANPEIARTAADAQLREPPARAPHVARAADGLVGESTRERAVAQPDKTTGIMAPPIQSLAAGSGSRVRIEGTSNIHNWLAEGSVIQGYLELDEGFFLEPKRSIASGPVQAQAEAVVPVRTLRSVSDDGSQSDAMDQIMYESLKAQQNPQIVYRLEELSLRGKTNVGGTVALLDSRGELTVAGVTNEIEMPVLARSLGNGKFKVSGRVSLSLASFGIELPAPKPGQPVIRPGDEINVSFDWVVDAKRASSSKTQNELVPLVLELPAPAYKTVPKDLPIGPEVEPLANKPRAPIMVPPGLENVAPSAVLSSSDKNVGSDSLARIIDGDKNAGDQSIIYLRKGPQWVQMEFGSPQEIFAIVIWHAHNTAKVYHDVIVEAADDAGFTRNIRTIFNNDKDDSSGRSAGHDREYLETYEGKLLKAKGVKARCLRFYSKGSTESALNEYTEIEVYGREAR